MPKFTRGDNPEFWRGVESAIKILKHYNYDPEAIGACLKLAMMEQGAIPDDGTGLDPNEGV